MNEKSDSTKVLNFTMGAITTASIAFGAAVIYLMWKRGILFL